MTYSPPSIGTQGLTIPQYNDILNYYVAGMQSIYGTNIALGNDSADYQFLSILALAANDAMSCCQLAYNSFSALTVTGAAQDQLYTLNGLARKIASCSTCAVYLTGTAGLTITNGKVSDINNNIWDLPSSVTFNSSGNVTVTVTCETIGAITALIGNINTINTPTYGWTSVTNTVAAVVGQPIETDSQFRARQAVAVESPSQSMLTGTEAAIAQISGVNRFIVYENPTSVTDSYGNPPHSITCVVEGGLPSAIANAIYVHKGGGCGTNGTTTVNITDQYGLTTPINFYALAYTPIYATLNIHALAGYTTATTAAIQAAIVTYLNSLQIGETVILSALWASAMLATPNLSQPLFSVRAVTAGTSSNSQGTTDIPITYNYASQGLATNIIINQV
jgi:uncharacterized phage protein gp47/JayE